MRRTVAWVTQWYSLVDAVVNIWTVWYAHYKSRKITIMLRKYLGLTKFNLQFGIKLNLSSIP